MAEDIREQHTAHGLTEQRRAEIVKECERQEESCLYTSTTFYIWLRRIRLHHKLFISAPILLGGLAGLSALKDWLPDYVMALLAFAASLFPALADALQIQTNVEEISRLAAEYKALEDRFRRLAKIGALSDLDSAEKGLAELMDRLDVVRSTSITAPEWAFKKAREKIAQGHYSFAVDAGKTSREGGAR
jgi:hypothetical protein